MRVVLLQTGKTDESYISEGIEVYSARIRKITGFEIITLQDVKNSRNMTGEEVKDKEGKKILGSLKEGDYTILLDENGKEFRTVEFTSWLGNRFIRPLKRLVFVVGGAWGFSEEVYKRADMKLALSKMTFPHQLVRLIFVEQLYRALSIMKGSPYHHE